MFVNPFVPSCVTLTVARKPLPGHNKETVIAGCFTQVCDNNYRVYCHKDNDNLNSFKGDFKKIFTHLMILICIRQ